MDLEDAATEALARVRELEGEVAAARHSLDEAEGQLKRLDGQIETDWVPVSNDAQELLRRIEEEQARLDQDAVEAIGAVDAVMAAVHTARTDGDEALEEAGEKLGLLQERVKGLESDLAAFFDDADAAAAELESLAAARQRQLDGVLSRMNELLDECMVPFLEDVEQELLEWKRNVERYVAEMWIPVFDEMAQAWEGCLTGAVGAVLAAGVDKASERAQAMVAAHVEECEARYGDTLDEIGALHDELTEALLKLEAAIEEGAARILDGGSKGAQELAQDGEGLAALQRALESVKDRLASFSFVRI
jgi:DNA repair exonuclease SbcCD ATPase subunit